MLTGLLVVLAFVAIFTAGEAVRGQCRRMLTRPVAVRAGMNDASVISEVAA
jgi:hypothetical protein